MRQYQDLQLAARKLLADLEGSFTAFDWGIRDVIGNTNYSIIEQRIEDLKTALANLPPPPEQQE